MVVNQVNDASFGTNNVSLEKRLGAELRAVGESDDDGDDGSTSSSSSGGGGSGSARPMARKKISKKKKQGKVGKPKVPDYQRFHA